MNARANLIIPAIGEHVEGGRFHGIHLLNGGDIWGEVSAPKACQIKGMPWHPQYQDVPGAAHDYDGLANTIAMAEAGSPIAQAARACREGGHDDWYIAARGGLLLQAFNLKPLLEPAEAFEAEWYWSSTQYSRGSAFYQHFGHGYTDVNDKDWQGGWVLPVRRFRIQ